MAKCDYCGAERELFPIMNPNFGEEKLSWDVCVICKEVLKWQQQLVFASFLATHSAGRETADRLIAEAHSNLDRIAREQKIPILSAQLTRQPDGSYDAISIEYTGKGGLNG